MFAFATSALFTMLTSISVQATDYTWINNSGTSTTYYWTNTANWSPTGVPGATDNVTFSTIQGSNWAVRVDSDISVQNISISDLNKTFDIIPKNGSGNNNSLTIEGTLSVSGNSNYLANIRQEEGADHSLSVNVNNIIVTNAVLRFGTSISTGTYGRELDHLTSTGTTTLNAGGAILLALRNDATLGVVEFNGGLLALTNSDPVNTSVSQKLTVSGLDGTSGTIVTASRGSDQNGSTTPNANNTRVGELIVNTAESKHHIFGGVIADKTSASVLGTITLSLVKNGAGIQELFAANTYSGGTIINAGTLIVSNTSISTSATGSGAVFVEGGGTLAGTGFIGGSVFTSGHLSPGNIVAGDSEAGILTFNNTLTLNSGTFLDFNLATPDVAGGMGGNDFISVLGTTGDNGDLTLGSSITLNLLGSGIGDGVYQLLGYTGTLTGASSLSSWMVAGLDPFQNAVFDYSSNSVFVTIATIPEPKTAGLLAGAMMLLGGGILRSKKARHYSTAA